MSTSGYGFNMHFTYIDEALRSRWDSFVALDRAMLEFSPKPRSHFDERRDAIVAHMKKLNPGASEAELNADIERDMDLISSHAMQFDQAFRTRMNAEYVTIVMLSHSLCEALINAVLAIGLMKAESTELFELLEMADFCKKWRTAPKSFLPTYEFPSGGALYESLKYLSKVRNFFVHHKIDVEVDGKKVIKGSHLERLSFDDTMRWARRFFNLPYDLAEFMMGAWRECPLILLDRGPIERVVAHGK